MGCKTAAAMTFIYENDPNCKMFRSTFETHITYLKILI